MLVHVCSVHPRPPPPPRPAPHPPPLPPPLLQCTPPRNPSSPATAVAMHTTFFQCTLDIAMWVLDIYRDP